MAAYNKKITWDEDSPDANLVPIYSADTFDHLPRCPSRVLPPLCLRIPPEFDVEAQSDVPRVIESDADALHWFFKVVRQGCECFDTPFDAADFIRTSLEGPQYLTTRTFAEYSKAWSDNGSEFECKALTDACVVLHALVNDYTAKYDQASDEARMLLALTGELVERFYNGITVKYDRDHGRPKGEYHWPVQLRGSADWAGGVSDILAGRFLDSQKCLYTYSRISDLFHVGIVFYMSQLDGSEGGQRHDACTTRECKGHNINPATHRATHVHPSCTCSMFDADLDTIADILSKPDLIPVMVFDEGAELKVRVVPQSEVSSYIAISYVASQLFGSPLANSLPSCQMLALRHVVRFCSKSLVKSGEVCGLWIDTLHVPVEAVRQVSRDQALLKMKLTMERAIVVLVVDPCLAKRAATEFVPEEFMASLVCSPWFSRLWTFSESQFASSLWVWYAGGPQSVDEFLQKQGWPPPGHSWRTYNELETIGRLREESRARGNRPKQGHRKFDIIMEMLRHRQTSQPADEPFCLSMLMDLDTPGMLARPVELRMEFFYKQLRDISAILLIQSGERLTTPGFRWAPKTLLGRKVISRYAHEDDCTIRTDALGILVPPRYHAFELELVMDSQKERKPPGSLLFQRLFFRIRDNDIYNVTTEDGVSNARQMLVMFETTGDVHDPAGERRKRSQQFEISSERLILLHRGWFGPGGVGPAVLLEYEGLSHSQSSDNEQRSEKPRILTRYGILGGFQVLPQAKKDELEAELELDAAFDGDQPLNEQRAVFNAERISLPDVEVWVS